MFKNGMLPMHPGEVLKQEYLAPLPAAFARALKFGMKARIGADLESGLVHHVHSTTANVADVTQVTELLHGALSNFWMARKHVVGLGELRV